MGDGLTGGVYEGAVKVGTILYEKQKNPYILEGLGVSGSSVEIRGAGSWYLTLSEVEVYIPRVEMGKFSQRSGCKYF